MTPLPRWLRVCAFWIPLVIASFMAFAPEGPPLPFRVSDIVLHAFAFTYLTAALWIAHYQSEPPWKPALWMLGYGVLIEFVQSFEPARSAEIKDVAVDMIGIGLGLALYRGLLRIAAPVFRDDVPKHQL